MDSSSGNYDTTMRRLAAAFIDMSLVSVLWVFVTVPITGIFLIFYGGTLYQHFIQMSLQPDIDRSETMVLALIFVLTNLLGMAVVSHGYFIVLEKKEGTTYGKRLFALRVEGENGGPLTWKQATYRDLARWYFDGIFFFISVPMMFLKGKRVGDFLAETKVSGPPQTRSIISYYIHDADYLRLAARLQPRAVEKNAIARDYLEFAFQNFVRDAGDSGVVGPSGERERWLHYIREFLKPPAELGLNDMTLLRFFAGHCERASQ